MKWVPLTILRTPFSSFLVVAGGLELQGLGERRGVLLDEEGFVYVDRVFLVGAGYFTTVTKTCRDKGRHQERARCEWNFKFATINSSFPRTAAELLKKRGQQDPRQRCRLLGSYAVVAGLRLRNRVASVEEFHHCAGR